MGQTRLDLEAALAQDFSDQNLAVYADLLQAEGDPRGELITIDQRIARFGPGVRQPTRGQSSRPACLGSASFQQTLERSWLVRWLERARKEGGAA